MKEVHSRAVENQCIAWSPLKSLQRILYVGDSIRMYEASAIMAQVFSIIR